MTTFALFFSYTPETWGKLIDNPGDRTAAVRALTESVGGELTGLYYMLGDDDGFVLFDAPDVRAAGALSLAVNSTGAFSSLRTCRLIEAGELVDVLGTAGAARAEYVRQGT
jgi:uncharacterized protein with GYD domain